MRFRHVAGLGVLVAALVLAPNARAQDGKGGMTKAPWLIGPWVGVNFATFGGSDASGAGTHTGVTAGAQIQHALGPDLFVRLGALYSMRGEEESGVAIELNYIEFPLVLGYEFPLKGSRVQPYLFAGGQFGFKASCNISGSGTSVDCDTFFQSVGANASIASTDVGVTGGAGVGLPLGTGRLMLDARYYLGFTKLVTSGGTTVDLKNKGFTIAAGYMIPFGH